MTVKIKTVLMKNVTKMHGPLIHCEHNSGNKSCVYHNAEVLYISVIIYIVKV